MNHMTKTKISWRTAERPATYHDDYVILIAEDDDDDFLLLQMAFVDAEINNPVVRLNNGKELLDYLHQASQYKGQYTQRPMVLLLDINMPLMNGFEALKSIRCNEEWNHMPIIILSTAITDEAVEKSYKLGANSYITKPNNFDTLVHICETFKDYWLSVVEMETRR